MNKGQLRLRAGISVFERGEAIARRGAVVQFAESDQGVSAQVQGTERYQVVITQLAGKFKPQCSCPAAEYQPVCKHAVAAALVYLGEAHCNPSLQTNTASLALPGREEVTAWLSRQDKSTLVALIDEQLQLDASWFDALQYQCAVQLAGEKLSRQQVIGLIDEALPLESAWEDDAAQAYFEAMNGRLDALEQALLTQPDSERYGLAWYALKRLDELCCHYVASFGDHEYARSVLVKLALDALLTCASPIEDKLAFLIEVMAADLTYSDLSADELEAEAPQLSLALQQHIKSETLEVPISLMNRLARHYSRQAAQDKQWLEAIDWLLRKQLQGEDQLALARYHLQLRQFSYAEQHLRYAQKAQAGYPGWATALIEFECELATALGDIERLWQIRWNRFETHSSVETVMPLLDFIQQFPQQREWRISQVVTALEQKMEQRPSETILLALCSSAMAFERLELLLRWCQHPLLPAREGAALAPTVAPINEQIAGQLYEGAITTIVDEATKSAYLEVVALMAQYQQMASIEPKSHQRRWQRFDRQLRQQNKRKRNFIRFLDEHFA